MLPAAHRLRASADFSQTTRHGRRVAMPRVVFHFLAGEPPARIGFVVSKAVGGSVTRHRVTRRLRAAVAEHLAVVPNGTVVIRALPSAATAAYSDLRQDVGRALEELRVA